MHIESQMKQIIDMQTTGGMEDGKKNYRDRRGSMCRMWSCLLYTSIRIAAAHTDFPCLRIKPSCDIQTNGYAQVNVEVYGGAILNTWLDRPLGVARCV